MSVVRIQLAPTDAEPCIGQHRLKSGMPRREQYYAGLHDWSNVRGLKLQIAHLDLCIELLQLLQVVLPLLRALLVLNHDPVNVLVDLRRASFLLKAEWPLILSESLLKTDCA